MNGIRKHALCLLVALAIAGNLLAMDIAWQYPTFDSNMVLTTSPLTVVFDQSLDTSSVNDTTFFVKAPGAEDHVAGSIAFATTNQENDTVVFTPGQRWEWAVRYELSISTNVQSSQAEPFSGDLLTNGLFVANIPNDFVIPEIVPEDPIAMTVRSTPLMGFNPIDPEADAEPWQIPGLNVTDGWKYTTGHPDVVIAVLDNGLRGYHNEEYRRALFLNAGELPLPDIDGIACEQYDCNLDGRFDVDDYALDSRVERESTITVQHLLDTFSDNVDDDENGLTDDICGWDFFRNSNEILGIEEFPEGTHMDGEVRLIVAEGNDGSGSIPGICPGCMILPVRVGQSLLYDYGMLGAGARYANSMGANIMNFAGVNLTWSERDHQPFIDAADQGAATIAASGDEITYHHWMPAAGESVINVKTIFPMVPGELLGFLPLEEFGFTETFCTNYGTHVQLSVPATTGCTSDSTGNTSGMMGLLMSWAREREIELEAEEAKQILTLTADDIANRCYTFSELFNLTKVCQEGVDLHFGYGRPEMEKAILALGDPQFGIEPAIPPAVRIADPAWWQTIDPTKTTTLDVTGLIRSRHAPFQWEVQIGWGPQPLDDEFVTLATGASSSPIEGLIASVNVEDLYPIQQITGAPENQYSFGATIRVQASYETTDGIKVLGEDRKSISFHVDDDPAMGLVPGFPMELDASGESSPLLYDLDGDPDQRQEIIFATGDGKVVALKHDPESDEWVNMPGFPVDLSGDDPWVKNSIFASVAVGDIFGNGTPQIVAADLRGNIWAINPDTASDDPILAGFPVSADAPDNTTALDFGNGNGFIASPLLVDLDADGTLEIVAASSDLKVYAWSMQSGTPQRMPGWPVLCRSEEGLVPQDKVCGGPGIASMIIATPAAGILDPSSTDPDIANYPSVVVATTETCEGKSVPESRVYAIYHNGTNHAGGAFLPGWPACPIAILGDSLPIPMAVGSVASPAVVVTELGTYISVGSAAWLPQMIQYVNGEVIMKDIPATIAVNFVSSGAFSSLAMDGAIQYVMPLLSVLKNDDALGFSLFHQNIAAFDLAEPHDMVIKGDLEDHPMLNHPIVADLDGDGLREIMSGSGGYLVHAHSIGGTEPYGWPKYTQKWIMASPAVGDIDADGKIETVVHTREGVLYAWESEGDTCVNGVTNSDWGRYHHDERNTGVYNTDATPPARITDPAISETDDGQLLLSFTAPGDDWSCGQARNYDIRYSIDESADLTDPEQFQAAEQVPDVKLPALAGEPETIALSISGITHIAIQTKDDAGNVSRISIDPFAEDEEPDDDDDDEDGDDDDDDDDGCCG